MLQPTLRQVSNQLQIVNSSSEHVFQEPVENKKNTNNYVRLPHASYKKESR